MRCTKMKKTYLFLCLLLTGILTLSSVVFAVDTVKYDFDEVNVLYAAEFDAKPIEGVDASGTWASDLAGEDKKLTILYGVIELKSADGFSFKEEFIKVGG